MDYEWQDEAFLLLSTQFEANLEDCVTLSD